MGLRNQCVVNTFKSVRYSRRIPWLKVGTSHNNPCVIAYHSLFFVEGRKRKYTCNNIVFSLLGSFGVIWVLKMLFYNAVGLTANSFRYGKYPVSVIKGVTIIIIED